MKKIIKEIIPYIMIIIFVAFIRTFVVTPVRVDGESMKPTLSNSEILMLEKFDKTYKRFDIIVFNNGSDKLVKRIIGMPGERVEIKNNKLYINGKYMKEPFKHKDTDDYELDEVIPKNSYFVLGDNRGNSLDSRFGVVGFVPRKNIKGTVSFSLYPLKKVN